MTTLIEVRSSDGTVRRCDASCHTAAKPKCRCICEGRFHGRRRVSELDAAEVEEAGRQVLERQGGKIIFPPYQHSFEELL